MKYLFLFLCLIMPSICFADGKIYRDGNKEVVDLSSAKTIPMINAQFVGNFTDITSQEKTRIDAENIQREKDRQSKENNKKSAIKKLKDLGLTDDEINALK